LFTNNSLFLLLSVPKKSRKVAKPVADLKINSPTTWWNPMHYRPSLLVLVEVLRRLNFSRAFCVKCFGQHLIERLAGIDGKSRGSTNTPSSSALSAKLA
jgi:hypothetical protein